MALPTCECVKGLPIGEQLAAIYCATYTLAAGDVDGPYLLKAANLSDVADADASRGNISAAKSGANTDITSITGLTGNVASTGGKLGIGATTWPTEVYARIKNTTQTRNNIQVQGSGNGGMTLTCAGNSAFMSCNAVFDGANWTADTAGTAAFFGCLGDNSINFYQADTVAAGATFTLTNVFTIEPNGGRTIIRTTAFFLSDITADKTITPGGTTGNQIINKNAGSVNFAGGATSLTVTNNRVTSNSVILATVATNDNTMKSVSAVPGAGSFVLNADAAATAETRVNFWIVN